MVVAVSDGVFAIAARPHVVKALKARGVPKRLIIQFKVEVLVLLVFLVVCAPAVHSIVASIVRRTEWAIVPPEVLRRRSARTLNGAAEGHLGGTTPVARSDSHRLAHAAAAGWARVPAEIGVVKIVVVVYLCGGSRQGCARKVAVA